MLKYWELGLQPIFFGGDAIKTLPKTRAHGEKWKEFWNGEGIEIKGATLC